MELSHLMDKLKTWQVTLRKGVCCELVSLVWTHLEQNAFQSDEAMQSLANAARKGDSEKCRLETKVVYREQGRAAALNTAKN